MGPTNQLQREGRKGKGDGMVFIMDHVDEHGVVQRVHGNTGRKTAKSLQFEDIKFAYSYISQTAEEIGLPQPAAPRGSDNIPPVFLPSNATKLEIHFNYEQSCREADLLQRPVHYKTVCNIWSQCLPHIKIASPLNDVCASCEVLKKRIMDSRKEIEKIENTEQLINHILTARKERETHNTCVKRARETSNQETNRYMYVHLTFDFSQNVS